MSRKRKLEKMLIQSAAVDLHNLNSSYDEEIEHVLGDLFEDLSAAKMLFREDTQRIEARTDVQSNSNIPNVQPNVPANLPASILSNVPASNVSPSVPAKRFVFSLSIYDDQQFRKLLGVRRKQFNVILQMLKNHNIFNDTNEVKQLPPFFQFALTLYRLNSSGENGSLSNIANIFGIHVQSIVDRITDRVFKSIPSLQSLFMQWPTEDERNQLVSDTMNELPDCIGYEDSCQIPLTEKPSLAPDSYYNQGTNKYSIKVQVVCDSKKRLLYFVTGWPGSVLDYEMYKNSRLHKYPTDYFSESQWIAADGGFALSGKVLTPFTEISNTRAGMKNDFFNKKLTKYRVRIEHCIALLMQKFSSLNSLNIKICDVDTHKLACEWIGVSCILYNILLLHFDDYDKDYPHLVDGNGEQNCSYMWGDMDKSGERKRQAVIDIMCTL